MLVRNVRRHTGRRGVSRKLTVGQEWRVGVGAEAGAEAGASVGSGSERRVDPAIAVFFSIGWKENRETKVLLKMALCTVIMDRVPA